MNASFRLAQCHAKMKCFSEAVAALNRSVETLEANPAVEPRCSILFDFTLKMPWWKTESFFCPIELHPCRSKAQLSKQLRECAEKMRTKKDHVRKEAEGGQRLDDLMGEIQSSEPSCSYEIT